MGSSTVQHIPNHAGVDGDVSLSEELVGGGGEVTSLWYHHRELGLVVVVGSLEKGGRLAPLIKR